MGSPADALRAQGTVALPPPTQQPGLTSLAIYAEPTFAAVAAATAALGPDHRPSSAQSATSAPPPHPVCPALRFCNVSSRIAPSYVAVLWMCGSAPFVLVCWMHPLVWAARRPVGGWSLGRFLSCRPLVCQN